MSDCAPTNENNTGGNSSTGGGNDGSNGVDTVFQQDKVPQAPTTIRIMTWRAMEATLQPYVGLYNNQTAAAASSTSTSTKPPTIEFISFPNIQTLELELSRHQQRQSYDQSSIYDAFIVPTNSMGTLAQNAPIQNLRNLHHSIQHHIDSSDSSSNSNDDDDKAEEPFFLDNLLPYYQNHASKYDQHNYAVPLLGGSQFVLIYRKDWFQQKGIDQPPRTWEEYNTVAEALHSPPAFGSCLGRLSDDSYLSIMMLASLTQTVSDATAGADQQSQADAAYWLQLDDNPDGSSALDNSTLDDAVKALLISDKSLSPIQLQEALPKVLEWMEGQHMYGHPDELTSTAADLNVMALLDGTCGMTITDQYPMDILEDTERFGIASIPGSSTIVRQNRLTACTQSTCNKQDAELGWINQVGVSSSSAPLGVISSTTAKAQQHHAFRFLEFLSTRSNELQIGTQDPSDSTTVTDAGSNETSIASQSATPSTQHQPLYQSQLDGLSTVYPHYATVIEDVVQQSSDANIASPPRIPMAMQFWDTLDSSAREYLTQTSLQKNSTTGSSRQQIATRIERSWEAIIDQHDARPLPTPLTKPHLPMSIWYQKSLNQFEPTPRDEKGIDPVILTGGWALAIISIVVSLYMAAWVVRNRRERVVLASQPYFLYMICGGTCIMGISIFFFGFDRDFHQLSGAVACNASIWLYTLGFSIAFSALFSKTWRINQIFRSSHYFQRIKVELQDVLIPFIFILSMNLATLLIWMIMEPLEFVWETEDGDDFSGDFYYYFYVEANGGSSEAFARHEDNIFLTVEPDVIGRCTSQHAILYLCILLGLNLVFAFVALIQAYECRRITTEYSESLWIAGTLLIMIQVWVVGVPLYGVVRKEVNARFIVIASIIFITIMTTLGFIFIPKMKHVSALSSSAAGTALSSSTGKNGKQLDPDGSDDQDTLLNEAENLGIEVRRSLPGNRGASFQFSKAVLHRKSSTRRGLRLFTSQGKHNTEVRQLKEDLGRTVSLNRTLQGRLDKLQEKYHSHRLRNTKNKISGKVVVVD